ncbi:MAG: glycine--tRNA ligase [Chloroflexi bacterium]|nr:glycine--tRNA ligase [Chloroflexota bacterium]
MNDKQVTFDDLVSLSKRRGIAFPSSDIYGGIQSTWDYGYLGTEMKRNIRELWWKNVVQKRDNVFGIEAAIITNPSVWEASGHVSNFTDPLVDCLECNGRFRADHIVDDVCPECRVKTKFTDERNFNLLFKTYVGPVEDDANIAYLRPETAQGMFVNFTNYQNTIRRKIPFGIAQIGKSFRNEITPGQFIFRTREFEQMEMEFFCAPEESKKFHEYWKKERMDWYINELQIPESKLRLRDHEKDELAHYSDATADIEFNFPWGWGELEGIAHRGDFDLSAHATGSGKKITALNIENNEHFIPHVIEPAVGVDRILFAILCASYDEEQLENGDSRILLRLPESIAPIQIAVLPLSKKDELAPIAKNIVEVLREKFRVEYDETQSIGKRYRRQDEIGTPYCVTCDFDSLDDQAVTVRFRDSMKQERVKIGDLNNYFSMKMNV